MPRICKNHFVFVAGAIITRAGEKYIDKIYGIGRSMPISMTAFAIGALSMIGVPPAPTFGVNFSFFKLFSTLAM